MKVVKELGVNDINNIDHVQKMAELVSTVTTLPVVEPPPDFLALIEDGFTVLAGTKDPAKIAARLNIIKERYDEYIVEYSSQQDEQDLQVYMECMLRNFALTEAISKLFYKLLATTQTRIGA